MRSVSVADITAETFAPYGDLLEVPATPPRQDRAARIENGRRGAGANLALIRSEPFRGLMPPRRLERHPHSSQAFLPLSVAGYGVVVAPDAGGALDASHIRACRGPGHIGIDDRAGVGHARMRTLRRPGTFAMLVHEDGTTRDRGFAPIAPVSLDVPASA